MSQVVEAIKSGKEVRTLFTLGGRTFLGPKVTALPYTAGHIGIEARVQEGQIEKSLEDLPPYEAGEGMAGRGGEIARQPEVAVDREKSRRFDIEFAPRIASRIASLLDAGVRVEVMPHESGRMPTRVRVVAERVVHARGAPSGY